ncbi:MBOAT family O-acyltransferase [Anaerostipes caccae]|nr:MBOAT family O-acyltransferase [Anaerostipes caccae]
MMAIIIINYLAAMQIGKAKNKSLQKVYLYSAIALNVGNLCFFKYLNFAVSNIDLIFGNILPKTNISLPIGISFFTFQAMSYIIDVYRGEVLPQRNPFFLGLYISLFPQLIAGPIVRYQTIEKQITFREIYLDKFVQGIKRFLLGLSKKVMLANNLAIVSDMAFSQGKDLSVCFAWYGAAAYALQIYFDFSGYSDMAIGLGKLFGFEFLENFNYPYLSKSIGEFWRRWHISLGSWFRDYVYIPLGGSKVGRVKLIRNLFIVWFLTGVWHGANWTFILWGLAYFVILTFEKLTQIPKRLESKLSKRLYSCFTLVFIMIAFVLFRSNGINEFIIYIKAMLCMNGNVFLDNTFLRFFGEYKLFLVFAVFSAFAGVKMIKTYMTSRIVNKQAIEVIIFVIYVPLFLINISYIIIGSYNPFIYFNF